MSALGDCTFVQLPPFVQDNRIKDWKVQQDRENPELNGAAQSANGGKPPQESKEEVKKARSS